MKTKAVPAIIMLTAGLIDCILSIHCHLSLWHFTWQLLLVLLIFYFLGCVVQLVLDKNFAEMEKETQEETKDMEEDVSGEKNTETEEEQEGGR